MSRKDWISREEEAKIPTFSNHSEAIKWFEEKYKEDFVLSDVTEIDDQEVFFCIYVVDRETHNRMKEYMKKNMTGLIPQTEETKGFMESYQPIQIYGDGRVHIVH